MCTFTNMLLFLQPQSLFLEGFQSASCVPEISRKYVCRRHGHHEFSEAIRWSALKWKIKELPCWVWRVRLGKCCLFGWRRRWGGRRDVQSAKFFQRTTWCPQERDSVICSTPVLAQWLLSPSNERFLKHLNMINSRWGFSTLAVTTCNRIAPRLDEWLSKRKDMGHPGRKVASARMSHDSTWQVFQYWLQLESFLFQCFRCFRIVIINICVIGRGEGCPRRCTAEMHSLLTSNLTLF